MTRRRTSEFRRRLSREWLFWLCAAIILLVIPGLLLAGRMTLLADQKREDVVRAEVFQSYEARQQIQEVLSLLQDAETGQRGYVLTGDPSFYTPSIRARDQLEDALDRLERLAGGEARQEARLQRLRTAIQDKLLEMDDVVRLRDTQGLTAAAARISRGEGRYHMDSIRAITAEILDGQAADLSKSLAANEKGIAETREHFTVLFWLMIGAILATSVMAYRYTKVRSGLIRKTRAESARRQAIFDSAMDAIITLNPSGGLETINKAGERMFGYPQETLLGRDISVLVPLASGEGGLFLDRLRESQDMRDGQTCELSARRSDGTTFPVDVNVGEMLQPDGAHIVAVMRDCTERKRADQAKNEFISTVSHELRTPLTSIAGSLGLLGAGAAGPLPERAARLVDIAESNSRRLVRLINDILDIEKIQSGAMSFAMKRLDFGELAHRAVEGVGGVAADLNVAIAYEPPHGVTVYGDADRLTQALTNLLSNAAKFSPTGGRVEVGMETTPSHVKVSVKDSGPGIPDEFRSRIFGKFAQADASDTRQKGGTGLGLVITKEIVERHGGRIWFDSVPGEGATFHIELPVVRETAVAPQAAGPRLLVCEDDPSIARVLAEALSGQGFQVSEAANLGEAETLLETETFDALLLDLRLPDGNGLDLLQKLRGRDGTRDLPVIIISGDRRPEGTGSFDVVDWIEKPVDLRRLEASLDVALTETTAPPLVLHVDDDPDLRRLVVEAFGDRGRIVAADSLAAARGLLQQMSPQLVILDVGLPDGSGLDLVPELVDRDGRPLPVVIFSAQGVERSDVAGAVNAVLTKSRVSLEELIQTVRRLSREKPTEAR